MKKLGRSARVIISAEARVLKTLRERNGLTQRLAASKLGFSASYLAQIENGRMNPPKGDRLLPFLKLYGDVGPKYYQELCKKWQEERTDVDAISDLLGSLSVENLKLVRTMVEQMASKGG
jgi:transcriptional regulator with XRE-family HTH domain